MALGKSLEKNTQTHSFERNNQMCLKIGQLVSIQRCEIVRWSRPREFSSCDSLNPRPSPDRYIQIHLCKSELYSVYQNKTMQPFTVSIFLSQRILIHTCLGKLHRILNFEFRNNCAYNHDNILTMMAASKIPSRLLTYVRLMETHVFPIRLVFPWVSGDWSHSSVDCIFPGYTW